jgi:hypothetical protein
LAKSRKKAVVPAIQVTRIAIFCPLRNEKVEKKVISL